MSLQCLFHNIKPINNIKDNKQQATKDIQVHKTKNKDCDGRERGKATTEDKYSTTHKWREEIQGNPRAKNTTVQKDDKSNQKEAKPQKHQKDQKEEKIPIILEEKDIEETFILGTGPGGQHVNKTKCTVVLKHIPSGVTVKCNQSRYRENNRHVARNILKEKIDKMVNGKQSKIEKRIEKERKRKARRKRKYFGGGSGETQIAP